MTIGFYRAGLIGDNVIALHGIYAIKFLYPQSKLVVYTNVFGINLYGQFDFIDSLINIDSMQEQQLIREINTRTFDCFLLTQPNRAKCKMISQTNAKRIITFRTLRNFIQPRFETVFISRNFSNIPQYQRILMLVRKIDSKHYKKNFHRIDFSAIRLTSKETNQAKIAQFLAAHNMDNISTPLIIVNPFVRSTHCNLTVNGYCTLIRTLASSYPQVNIVIPTYKNNIDISPHLQSLENVAIFYNDSDLLNIVALLESSFLLISPSTGISHIANNLKIPIIWLCSKIDKNLWVGDNMDSELFIVLDKPTQKLTKEQESYYINAITQKFATILHAQNRI
ncbi:glycosyltransferase family 9 protein [Helicobacter sp. MIT 14-3879]|uniref:glycosyltransferase family 9 protein n=1 Tax=Helicobacter sp. MIT 14-3879 TaxID=2040649 RepID=UPI000E1F7900|nr:glycosyltransferase family 9 protein [Helicobacter sp. MIT 14-3879]RDU60193.1 hypothetical protein CQA44_10810 [Helicobacter sp. MIT 14-3879]